MSPSPVAASSSTRVALAGFGAWGQMHVRAIADIDGAEVIAVLARSQGARDAAAELLPNARVYQDYAALLADRDVDVVSVVLPNHAHAEAAIAALDAGKHVFLEKPLGLTLAQCDAVAAASHRNDRLVAVNHELRVSKQWGAVHEIVARGELGSLRHQHLSLFRKPFRTGSGGWRYDLGRVGSWVLEELVHFIDLVLWYGEGAGTPTRVTAFGGDAAKGLSEHFTVVLEWEDGASAVLNQCLGGFEHHTLLEISGTAGALRTWWSGTMDRTHTPTFELKRRQGEGEVEVLAIPLSGEVFELEENLRRAFVGFAAGHSVMSPAQARQSVAVSLAAERSWRERQPVRLDLASNAL
jgi:myo-inositol 2-dehydrogenase/D-chiro-inositol 1-dehydrogenase